MSAARRRSPRSKSHDWLALAALARLLDLPREVLARQLAASGLKECKGRGEPHFLATAVLDALPPEISRDLREAIRRERFAVRTSRYWLSGYPELVEQWHPTKNGDLFPDEVRFGSEKRIWWRCPKGPDHEWSSPANRRTSGHGCPFCTGRRVSVTNSLATLFPELATQWHLPKNDSVTPAHVTAHSKRRFWWQCTKVSMHVWRASVRDRSKHGCALCAGKTLSPTRSLALRFPDIAAEWHPTRNAPLTPSTVFAGSSEKFWWKCAFVPSHVWVADIASRTGRSHGCPYCQGTKVSAARSLKRTFPAVAKQWHPTKNGALTPADVLPGAKAAVWWKCPKGPDHEWIAKVRDRTDPRRLTGCPCCANRQLSVTNRLDVILPNAARQWHPTRNGTLLPSDVVVTSIRVICWQCEQVSDHSWSTQVRSRLKSPSSGCPLCRR